VEAELSVGGGGDLFVEFGDAEVFDPVVEGVAASVGLAFEPDSSDAVEDAAEVLGGGGCEVLAGGDAFEV
jgi:hypothetical protein